MRSRRRKIFFIRHGVAIHIGGVVRLPLDVRKRQGFAIILDALGDVLRILLGKIGIAAFSESMLPSWLPMSRFG